MKVNPKNRIKTVTSLLNGTNKALQQVVPIQQSVSKPSILREILSINFGVFIGLTGDIKGRILFAGDVHLFGAIGETMFGTPLQDDMLLSFSGELGNMIAGNVSIAVENENLSIDITEPSIIQEKAEISEYEMAIHLISKIDTLGKLNIYILFE